MQSRISLLVHTIATTAFPGSSNTSELVWKFSNVRVSGESKMAAINRKWICNHIYFSSLTWGLPSKFHMYSLCSFRHKYFRFHYAILVSFWTRIEFCSVRCHHRQWRFRHSKKQTGQRWKYILNGHRVYHIFTKKSSTPLPFPVTSFAGIRRYTLENANGQLRYSSKTRFKSICDGGIFLLSVEYIRHYRTIYQGVWAVFFWLSSFNQLSSYVFGLCFRQIVFRPSFDFR